MGEYGGFWLLYCWKMTFTLIQIKSIFRQLIGTILGKFQVKIEKKWLTNVRVKWCAKMAIFWPLLNSLPMIWQVLLVICCYCHPKEAFCKTKLLKPLPLNWQCRRQQTTSRHFKNSRVHCPMTQHSKLMTRKLYCCNPLVMDSLLRLWESSVALKNVQIMTFGLR